MKRALLHTAELYADGIIEIDNAMDTVNSYMGMTEHCNGYNLRRWIEDNIVFAICSAIIIIGIACAHTPYKPKNGRDRKRNGKNR